jgi:hypothetical protein
LNTLGPDEQKWITGKAKYEEIVENLKNAEPSYHRTVGAIKCQYVIIGFEIRRR